MHFLLFAAIAHILLNAPAYAVTGGDVLPGTNCSTPKAMMMTANPSGIGGYILSCEGGKWRATLTADMPTLPDQVATKRYIDEHVATIETKSYVNKTLRTTVGLSRPIIITGMSAQDRAKNAATLCSWFSNGQYVLGKFISMREIHKGEVTNVSEGKAYRCQNECVGSDSGERYAWLHSADLSGVYTGYGQYGAGSPFIDQNPAELSTMHCASLEAGSMGTVMLDQECMAGATVTRSSVSGRSNPQYLSGYIIDELLCWAN